MQQLHLFSIICAVVFFFYYFELLQWLSIFYVTDVVTEFTDQFVLIIHY